MDKIDVKTETIRDLLKAEVFMKNVMNVTTIKYLSIMQSIAKGAIIDSAIVDFLESSKANTTNLISIFTDMLNREPVDCSLKERRLAKEIFLEAFDKTIKELK